MYMYGLRSHSLTHLLTHILCMCISMRLYREARKYVDKMCVRYEKSLLESGTMGTSGNVDTICPFKTQTYGMYMFSYTFYY